MSCHLCIFAGELPLEGPWLWIGCVPSKKETRGGDSNDLEDSWFCILMASRPTCQTLVNLNLRCVFLISLVISCHITSYDVTYLHPSVAWPDFILWRWCKNCTLLAVVWSELPGTYVQVMWGWIENMLKPFKTHDTISSRMNISRAIFGFTWVPGFWHILMYRHRHVPLQCEQNT